MKQGRAAFNLAVSLMLMLSLAACGDKSTPPSTDPPAPTTPTPKEIGGTIEGWIGQEAVVKWRSYNFENDGEVVFAEASISADGNFSLILPVGEVLASELFPFEPEFICSSDSPSTVAVNPRSVELAIPEVFSVYASADSDEELGQLLLESTDAAESLFYLYAASDATITGECVEMPVGSGGGGSSTFRFNLDLKAGWNEVVQTSSEAGFTLATESFSDTARWTYFEFDDPPIDPPVDPPVDPPHPCGFKALRC